MFDRGYVDYQIFNDYTERKIRFVTRLKDNALVEVIFVFSLFIGYSKYFNFQEVYLCYQVGTSR